MSEEPRVSRYSRAQRVLALVAAILLAGLSAAAFLVAILGGEGRTDLMLRLLLAAIFLPLLLWLLIWALGKAPNFSAPVDDKTDKTSREQ